MQHKDVLRHYLDRHAEPQAARATALPGTFDRAIVVPAFNEGDAILDTFTTLLDSDRRVLLVLVANVPDTCSDYETAAMRTAALADTLATRFPATWDNAADLSLHQVSASLSWLLVDCFSAGRRLPAKHGVGLARRIGCDIACALFAAGKLREPWFVSTDADVQPPPALASVAASEHAGAHTLPFLHRWEGDERTRVAARLYDFYLRYHVWGLATAGSPYAHLSVGSTLMLNASRYAQVRGFPKRSAGEDFHLLAKLAKLAPVMPLAGTPLVVRARVSARVPFGTGPAINTLRALHDPIADYRLLHPGCFHALRVVLDGVRTLYDERTDDLPGRVAASLPGVNGQRAALLLTNAGAREAVSRAREGASNRRRFLQHFHTWFDALKTQQFLHGLRDEGPGTLTLSNLLCHPLGPTLPPAPCETEAQLETVVTAMTAACDEALARHWAGERVFGAPTEPG
ncbi:MAG: hypothetical protein AAFN78_10325 [Pseudomonadota bacterium]